jgi:hypothetical protein
VLDSTEGAVARFGAADGLVGILFVISSSSLFFLLCEGGKGSGVVADRIEFSVVNCCLSVFFLQLRPAILHSYDP